MKNRKLFDQNMHRAFLGKKQVGIFLVAIFTSLSISGYSQSKKDKLQADKRRIEKDIAYTNKLLAQTKKSKELSLSQLIILNNQIEKRQELVGAIKSEVYYINGLINTKEKEIGSLSQEVDQIKKEYAKLIYFAYKNRSSYNRLMFLFSASDFNQAYKRLKYLQQYNAYRKKQAESLMSKQTELGNKIEELKSQKEDKKALLAAMEKEQGKLIKEKKEKDSSVEELKKKEGSLLEKIREKEKAANRLQREIKKLIAAEIKKSNPKGNAASKVYKMTPEEQQLSSNFSKNKGKLPWPSEKGIVTSTFGVHPHPVLSGIKVKNNGINIATVDGARARAIFDGQVKSVISLARNNNAIIIRHGEYLSVYTNIANVFVTNGQKVKTKEEIGIVNTNSKESKTELHLEIWHQSSTLNPINWLARMR